MGIDSIEVWFPKIIGKNYKIIKELSIDESEKFNCVSFSIDVFDDWIWPNESWQGLPRNLGIDGFKMFYEKHGYLESSDSSFDPEYDKVAFYSKNNIPTHAARQFGNMRRSKMSNFILDLWRHR
jgi:hypothetical protein